VDIERFLKLLDPFDAVGRFAENRPLPQNIGVGQ
jgi:hypothetical protein